MSSQMHELIYSKKQLDIAYNTIAGEDSINEWVQAKRQDFCFPGPNHLKPIWGVKYKLIRKLSMGQFGIVYTIEDTKAAHSGSEKIKVIKFISIDDMIDETIDAVKEAKMLSKLSCPFIVLFYDSFMEDAMFCLVTEYCEGGDLAMIIKQHQQSQHRIDMGAVLDWFLQLTIALEYIHQRKIIHRDLKTHNVFLKRNKVKLGDFGISRMMKSYNEFANTFVGTPYYMSPEVLKQEGYSFKSDIWALGCIFYELILLERPFQSPSIMSLIYKIVEEDPPNLPKCFSPDICNISMIMLEKELKLRPSAQEILRLSFLQTHVESMRCRSLYRTVSGSSTYKPDILTQISSSLTKIQDYNVDDATVLAFQTVDSKPSIKYLTPKERMLNNKMERAETIFNERCEMAHAQVVENKKLYVNEKSESEFASCISANHSMYTSAQDLNIIRSLFPKDNSTLVCDCNLAKYIPPDHVNNNYSIPYIPDDPMLAETYYLENGDFEDCVSENESDCISEDQDLIYPIEEYDCMLFYMKNAIENNHEMNFQNDELLSVSQHTFTHQERIKILKNKCLSTLGHELYHSV